MESSDDLYEMDVGEEGSIPNIRVNHPKVGTLFYNPAEGIYINNL
jgi:hypothetical protein